MKRVRSIVALALTDEREGEKLRHPEGALSRSAAPLCPMESVKWFSYLSSMRPGSLSLEALLARPTGNRTGEQNTITYPIWTGNDLEFLRKSWRS